MSGEPIHDAPPSVKPLDEARDRIYRKSTLLPGEDTRRVSTDTIDEIRIGPLAVRFLLSGAGTGGSLALFEFDVPSRARVPAAHSHDAYDETIYGVAGVLTWALDGRAIEVGPGDVLFIPRGTVHRFENEGEEDATALAAVTPGVLGPEYFRELAAVIAVSAPGPPDPSAIAEVMRRHGLTPA